MLTLARCRNGENIVAAGFVIDEALPRKSDRSDDEIAESADRGIPT